MDFESCTEEQQEFVRTDSKERYLSYALLRQIGNQHIKLKVYLQNDFTMENILYPKSRPQTLHLLDKYIKIASPNISASEGSSFAQGVFNKVNGGIRGRNKKRRDDKTYVKKYWKDKECYKFSEEDIRCLIAKRQKNIKTMITRAQVLPVVEQAWRS